MPHQDKSQKCYLDLDDLRPNFEWPYILHADDSNLIGMITSDKSLSVKALSQRLLTYDLISL